MKQGQCSLKSRFEMCIQGAFLKTVSNGPNKQSEHSKAAKAGNRNTRTVAKSTRHQKEKAKKVPGQTSFQVNFSFKMCWKHSGSPVRLVLVDSIAVYLFTTICD